MFCVPAVSTPGRDILPVPSNDTPPIVLAVSKAVAVDAFPVNAPVTLTVMLEGRPIVSVCPVADVSISLVVPAMVNV